MHQIRIQAVLQILDTYGSEHSWINWIWSMKAKRPNFPPTRELELPRNLSFPWPLAEPRRILRLPIQLPLATGGRRVANVGQAQRWGRELLAANRRVEETVERRAAAAPPSPALPAPSPVAPTSTAAGCSLARPSSEHEQGSERPAVTLCSLAPQFRAQAEQRAAGDDAIRRCLLQVWQSLVPGPSWQAIASLEFTFIQ